MLVAANTGAPLDAAGVESLATLRASAKRDSEAVGRYGVGFAAVLAVTDEPAVVSRHGGVRWSLAEARDLAGDTARHSPGLGDEIRRRDGHVPLLRLPFAAEGLPPAPYDTAVILPLRDTAAAGLAERLLHAVDDALLLALPGLEEVVVEVGQDAPAPCGGPPTGRTPSSSTTRATAPPAGAPPPRTARWRPGCWPTGPWRSGCGPTGPSPGRCPSTRTAPRRGRAPRPSCTRPPPATSPSVCPRC